jgi:aminocarboxymuconate-semialdehyde decarboxylase
MSCSGDLATPELLSHWFPAADADALCRYINEGIAELCNANPGKFIGIGMAPMQDASLAIKRFDEIKSLGLRGIEIGSHINGIPLGDIRLHDIYAAAEQAGLMVMVHPLHPLGLDRMGGRPELAAVAAFPLETAFAAVSLMTSGVTERFPNLRILLSHGGGALPWILPRLRHARTVGPPLDSLFPRDPGEMVKSFYYDTILYDDVALDYLVTKVGKERWWRDRLSIHDQAGSACGVCRAGAGPRARTFTSNAMGLLGLKFKAPA